MRPRWCAVGASRALDPRGPACFGQSGVREHPCLDGAGPLWDRLYGRDRFPATDRGGCRRKGSSGEAFRRHPHRRANSSARSWSFRPPSRSFLVGRQEDRLGGAKSFLGHQPIGPGGRVARAAVGGRGDPGDLTRGRRLATPLPPHRPRRPEIPHSPALPNRPNRDLVLAVGQHTPTNPAVPPHMPTACGELAERHPPHAPQRRHRPPKELVVPHHALDENPDPRVHQELELDLGPDDRAGLQPGKRKALNVLRGTAPPGTH